jgi:hypothetical protein
MGRFFREHRHVMKVRRNARPESPPRRWPHIGFIVALTLAGLIALDVDAQSPTVAVDHGVAINSVYSYAFPFVAEKSGYLQRVRMHIEVAESISPDVPVMLFVHNDRNGKIMESIAEVTRPVHQGASGREEMVFEVPGAVRLEQGQRYWLMCESPTGNGVLWWGTNETGQRFRKNVQSGQRTYETGPRAAFTAEIIASP